MYKNICLSDLYGSDPNKFARSVSKKLFTNKELMTRLLPTEPVFSVEPNDQEETDEDTDTEIDFDKEKGILIKRKVKLLVGKFI